MNDICTVHTGSVSRLRAVSLLLSGMSLCLLSILGIGLFLSTVLRTQQQALLAVMFFNMPAMLLSGFMFSIENLPKVFQCLTYVNPPGYFLVIIGGIFLKGNGIAMPWPQILALLPGTANIVVSSLRFKRRLE